MQAHSLHQWPAHAHHSPQMTQETQRLSSCGPNVIKRSPAFPRGLFRGLTTGL